MWIVKIALLFWGFIRKSVLGDNSILYALKYKKRQVLFVCIVFLSAVINIFTTYKLITLYEELLVLEERCGQPVVEKKKHDNPVQSTVEKTNINKSNKELVVKNTILDFETLDKREKTK